MTIRSKPNMAQRELARPPRSGFVCAIVGATVWAVSMLLLAIGLLTEPSGNGNDPVTNAVVTLAVLSLETVGAILVIRLPRNLIGWLLLACGFLIAFNLGTSGVADYGLNVHPGSVPGAIWLVVLSGLTWMPFSVGLGFYLPLLYPSGHLLSPRWRPVAFLGVVAIVFSTAQNALAPFTPGAFPPADQNPLAIGGPVGDLAALLGAASKVYGVFALPLAAASLVIRYRRASGIERQQLRWLAAVGIIVGPALVVAITAGITGEAEVANAAWLIVLVGFALLPIAIGVAVLRYRLYEIDRLISRTVAYGLLTAIVGGLFVGLILVFQAVLAPVTRSNELAVAGSTLVVAALFQPLRRRLQRLVDRRFNRARYDTERTVATFAARLRDEVDLKTLRAEVLATVAETVEPSSVSLWLGE
jgi:hypothetical protein